MVVTPTGVAGNAGLASAPTENTNVARATGLPPPPILVTETPPARVRQAAPTIPQAKPASSGSNVAIVLGIVAALVAAGGGGYWYFAGRTQPTAEVAEALPTPPASPETPVPTQATPTRQTVDAGLGMILADAGFSKTCLLYTSDAADE